MVVDFYKMVSPRYKRVDCVCFLNVGHIGTYTFVYISSLFSVKQHIINTMHSSTVV